MDTTPKGLATLAFLKARFDEGRDHLELLEPFVADALLSNPTAAFVPGEVAKAIRERSGLSVPSDAVKTVLGRFARRQELRRDGGRFLDPKMPDPDLPGTTGVRATENALLGEAFCEFAKEDGVSLDTDSALAAIAQFITDNKIPLVLDEELPDSPLDRSGLGRQTTRLIARFLTDVCLPDDESLKRLRSLIEGIVIQDMLLLRDVSAHPERFRGLTIVLDTSILLSALDLHGVANGLATREFLSLVREAGATTIAFDRTISEMRRILAVYEDHLSTLGGRLTLYPTELTHYVLTNHLAPSDIRTISATLERRLGGLAVPVRELPTHDRRFTLDEEALATALTDPSGQTDTPRIRHDVNAIASTLTLRHGHTATSVERSRAVFCTTSGRVIKNAQDWYRGQGEHGVPPIVHQYALSSIAWFKSPAFAAGVKVHELAAVCAAVLRPSRETWERFVRNLDELRQDGTITDDEAVAIVASELTEPLLATIDDSGEPDADTIRDVIDRVRAGYKAEFEASAVAKVQEAEDQVAEARREAATATAGLTAIEEAASRRAQRMADAVAVVVYWILLGVVLAAAYFAFFTVGPESKVWVRVMARVTLAAGVLVGLYSQVRGPSILQMRQTLADALATTLRDFLLGQRTRRTKDSPPR